MPSRRRTWIFALAGCVIVAGLVSGWHAYKVAVEARRFAALQGRARRLGVNLAHEQLMPRPFQSLSNTIGDPVLRSLGEDFGFQISCWGTQASSEELASLLDVGPLHTVYLGGATRLDDSWLRAIPDVSKIETLHLDATQITDASVDRILEMKNLGDISLVDTAISDSAVGRIRALPHTGRLYLGGPNIRAVQLVGGKAVDAVGQPATKAGPGISIQGQIIAKRSQVLETQIRLMIRTPGSSPPYRSIPYGWNVAIGEVGTLKPQSSSTATFAVPIANLPAGRSYVDIWVDDPPIYYRVGTIPVELSAPPELDESETEPVSSPRK